MQKYERAANRVSASKLWDMARVLATNTAYFYEGLDASEPPTASAAGDMIQDFLTSAEGLELATSFSKIQSRQVRRRVLELVRAVALDAEPVEG